MTSGDGIDELRAFAVELGKVATSALKDVDPIVKRGAQNVKDDLVADAEGSGGAFRGIGRTISYDRAYAVGQVAYEVGPDRDRGGQAPLAGIAYFGGANGGGGTLDIDGPLDREEPRLMKALDDYLGGLL